MSASVATTSLTDFGNVPSRMTGQLLLGIGDAHLAAQQLRQQRISERGESAGFSFIRFNPLIERRDYSAEFTRNGFGRSCESICGNSCFAEMENCCAVTVPLNVRLKIVGPEEQIEKVSAKVACLWSDDRKVERGDERFESTIGQNERGLANHFCCLGDIGIRDNQFPRFHNVLSITFTCVGFQAIASIAAASLE